MSDDECPLCHERGYRLGSTAWRDGGETTDYLCSRCGANFTKETR